jgi:hypothetical protein
MRYEKPELLVLGPALNAVQSHVLKGNTMPEDGIPKETTSPAYEADE